MDAHIGDKVQGSVQDCFTQLTSVIAFCIDTAMTQLMMHNLSNIANCQLPLQFIKRVFDDCLSRMFVGHTWYVHGCKFLNPPTTHQALKRHSNSRRLGQTNVPTVASISRRVFSG